MRMPEITPSDFAEKLAAGRTYLGLSQVALSRLCGVSPRTIWNWENKRQKAPSPIEMLGTLEILHAAKPKKP